MYASHLSKLMKFHPHSSLLGTVQNPWRVELYLPPTTRNFLSMDCRQENRGIKNLNNINMFLS